MNTKSEETTILYKVSASLTLEDGYKTKVTEIETKVTKGSYMWPRNRIKKGDLMEVKTIMYETSSLVMYHIYCFKADVNMATEKLRIYITKKMEDYTNEINTMNAHLSIYNHAVTNYRG